MKHLANTLSLSRVALSLALPFSISNAVLFITIYALCGLSDVLDGIIARKTNTQSELGARLDSIADLIFFSVVTVSIILWLRSDVLMYLPWVILIVILRCVNMAIAAWKYRTFAIVHTYGNKLTGILVFVSPVFIMLQQNALLWLLCIAGVMSSIEETVIHLTSASLDLNRRSIFTGRNSIT